MAWLPAPLSDPALPFQPRSFRDCSLYEQHWIQSSRGYARRFLPAASVLTSLYEGLTRRPFPAFKPHPLAYRQPVYYFGNHLSFIASGRSMRIPAMTQALDYELELGAVLRQPLRDATPSEALAAIGGFVVINDWSARDLQRAEMRTGLGPQKCKHFCSSMSAEFVDAQDVLPRIEQLQAQVLVNGELVARTSTAQMLHGWGETLSFLSRHEPLWPGELIASGTLPFGTALENGQWLRPGDALRLVIDGVGEINHVIAA
jgi:2-keto-4-pentenoate hydratase/2-oxohepta-3-ene-1,7-dioic acid hydratase in catechol pathway